MSATPAGHEVLVAAAAAGAAPWPGRLARLGLGIALVLAAWQAASFWHYVNDDAYITFRYSRFLATGRGPYFNLGEHVEGYSNLLLMLLLVPVYWIGGANALPVTAKLLGVVCWLACCGAAFGITRMLLARIADAWTLAVGGTLAAALAAVSASCALNATSGLETLLFAATITFGVWLGLCTVATSRWHGAGFAFAAAALTRPEGAAIFAVYWLAVTASCWQDVRAALRRPWRSWLRRREGGVLRLHLLPDGAIVVAAFVAQSAFRFFAYDGELLPNTYYAKAGGFWQPAVDYVWESVGEFTLGWLGLIAGVAGWLLARGVRRASLPLVAVAVAGVALPLITGPDWMLGGRMIAPFLPLLGVVLAIGCCRLLRPVSARRPAVALALLAIVPLSYWWQHPSRQEWRAHTLTRARGYERGHAALARFLRDEAAKAGDTVALMDIGIVGYLCDRQQILDITGLTDRHIAKSPGQFLNKAYDPAYVLARRPEFVVLVLGALGDPARPIPDGTALRAATPMETRLWAHPDFRRGYHERGPRPRSSSWIDGVAGQVKAYRVYEHDYPGSYYLLALFRLQE